MKTRGQTVLSQLGDQPLNAFDNGSILNMKKKYNTNTLQIKTPH